jgi:hypothetical protein
VIQSLKAGSLVSQDLAPISLALLALSSNVAGKRLELLRELVLPLSKVAVLWNPANSAEAAAAKVTETAALSLGCP